MNDATEPFCMVSFLGRLCHQQKTFRLDMMTQVAAIRFDHHPCDCEGCQAFIVDLVKYGTR